MKTKAEKHEGTVAEFLGWYTDIQELAEEMRSWEENLGSSSLSGTAKYDSVSECADTLEEQGENLERACAELEEELGEWGKQTKLTVTTQRPYGKRSPARWLRLSNAMSGLREALDAAKERAEELTPKEEEVVPQEAPPPLTRGITKETFHRMDARGKPAADDGGIYIFPCDGYVDVLQRGDFSLKVKCGHGIEDFIMADDLKPIPVPKKKREHTNDLEGYIEEIEEALDELDGVEFPGMYG